MPGARLPILLLKVPILHLGGCQMSGPFFDLYYNAASNSRDAQKGTTILTATHLWCTTAPRPVIITSSGSLQYMSYRLTSLKGGLYRGLLVIKRGAMSLDYGSYVF